MDVADDADGSLDPRVQIELENLNNATDDINKLETELDEAHTAFRQLLSESTKRLKEIVDKVGSSCIEKARCYYEALEVARQAQVKCQQQAQLFQRASEIHAAAKETVALAEARFMSHQHEWNFDQAWQDMLNHATIKVMDAENQKTECGREHHRRAMLFHDAEKRLLQLEEKHRRSIIKARPYFEVKAQCDQMLSTQKERVECLQKAIKDAKKNYSTSLRTLEEISNQIHQQRRDYDFMANGPREPGVGAELVSPERNLNYEMEFNQLNSNKVHANTNNHLNKDSCTKDYNNVCESKEDAERLDKRSVDGSEATSSQWELELQVSMENLNKLSVESAVFDNDQGNIGTPNLRVYDETNANSNVMKETASNFSQNKEFPTHTLNQLQKFTKNFQVLKKPLVNASLMTHIQGLRAVKNDIADSIILNKSKIALKNYVSKSLSGSPINMNVSKSEGSKVDEKVDDQDIATYVPNKISSFGLNNKQSRCNSDINLSWCVDITSPEKYQNSDNGSVTNDILDYKTDNQVTVSSCRKEPCTVEETSGNDLNDPKVIDRARSDTSAGTNLHLQTEKPLKRRLRSKALQIVSHSASSSPIKLKSPLALSSAKSLDKKLTDDSSGYPTSETSKTSSIKELPLLSIFEKVNPLANSKGRSASMINLDDKKSLMLLLDRSHLDNMQTVSAERLANARYNLFPKSQDKQ